MTSTDTLGYRLVKDQLGKESTDKGVTGTVGVDNGEAIVDGIRRKDAVIDHRNRALHLRSECCPVAAVINSGRQQPKWCLVAKLTECMLGIPYGGGKLISPVADGDSRLRRIALDTPASLVGVRIDIHYTARADRQRKTDQKATAAGARKVMEASGEDR